MDWIRLLRLASALPPSFPNAALAVGLAESEHRHRKGRRRRRRRCHKRRKAMGILALVAAFLAGKCCGMKKRGGCGSGGCGSCGCNCSCAGRGGCCCCKGGGGGGSCGS